MPMEDMLRNLSEQVRDFRIEIKSDLRDHMESDEIHFSKLGSRLDVLEKDGIKLAASIKLILFIGGIIVTLVQFGLQIYFRTRV